MSVDSMEGLAEIELCAVMATKVYQDGNVLRWKSAHKKALIGQPCGRKDKHGYYRIHILRGRMLQVHRLVFYMAHGYLPINVDHIDGVRDNNSPENLRAATIQQNSYNKKTLACNTSGRTGVYAHKSTGKWQASIRADGKVRHLGLFEKFEDAVSARQQAEEKYHGQFARR